MYIFYVLVFVTCIILIGSSFTYVLFDVLRFLRMYIFNVSLFSRMYIFHVPFFSRVFNFN